MPQRVQRGKRPAATAMPLIGYLARLDFIRKNAVAALTDVLVLAGCLDAIFHHGPRDYGSIWPLFEIGFVALQLLRR